MRRDAEGLDFCWAWPKIHGHATLQAKRYTRMTKQPWIVHKFGGTSVANAERYRHVAKILSDRGQPKVAVVVSAMSKVTDALIELVTLASKRDERWRTQHEALKARQLGVVHELLAQPATLSARFKRDFDDIHDLLHACWLLRSASNQTMDLITGHGELWSAQLLCAYLKEQGVDAGWLDARDVIRVIPSSTGGTPKLLLDQSQELMDAMRSEHPTPACWVVTGFIASTPEGLATTLGRNGSDYSAAIISNLLDAPELLIWTDVDGVLSANPKQVPEAVVLDELSYQEAMELAYFGAKVLHPSTIAPAISKRVHITIKNTFAPEVPGTAIHATPNHKAPVKGFATIERAALLNLEGTTLIGVPGIAEKLFGALRQASVSVIMISQASSEHSICFVLPEDQIERAKAAVEGAFFAERLQGQLQSMEVVTGCSVLAAVGDGMAGATGVAARFFKALGDAQINIRAIAQGSSERNISVVIDGADTTRALRAVHAGFYLSAQTLSVGLIGPGTVGRVLLEQLAAQAALLKRTFNVDLRIRGIATSNQMVLDDLGIDLERWPEALEGGQPLDLEAFLSHVDADFLPHAVVIDCTASDLIASCYESWLKQGVHVITPNKKANTASMSSYRALRRPRQRAHYLYETTVGAGLPIIHTVRDLVQTGDTVLEVEGVLSGTLSYLFNSFDGQQPFSALVKQAKALGYTEPDPREDLSGTDVARKLVILAREIGLELELDQVKISSLIPEGLEQGSIEHFLTGLEDHDEAMQRRFEQAKAADQVLRFVGKIDEQGQASVSLQALPSSHPFARIQLTDNIVLFKTARYNKNPLVIQGPGAGPEVTAAGVFADLLRLASYLGASR